MARILDFADSFESSVEPTASPVAASAISNTPSGNLAATNVQAALNELQGDIDTINTSKGANNGIATLDSGGKVPSSQLPAIAITEVYVVADITARDALTVDEGDIAKVTDAGGGTTKTYIYDGSSWIEIQADGQLATHEADTSTHGVSTIAGLAETQVFTNKDYDGGTASNTSRLTLPKNTLTNLQALSRKEGTLVYSTDQQKAYVDNGSALIPVGSGSGGGSLNYIENPDAETDTTGWATYADAAGTQPVDGTGGTANITWTRSTSSPLRGTASFLLTKDAADRQGEGGSYDFTIDEADKAKVMQIGFDYAVASGTYATGDVAIYIVDVTNGTVIQPSAYQVENVGVNSTARLTFQTASDSTSYRLCFHVASTSASAYSLKFDNIQLGPQVVPLGAPVTDWVSYTPETSWSAGVGTLKGKWRRVGDSMEVFVQVPVTGTPTSTTFNARIPVGYTIDTTKMPVGSITNLEAIGEAIIHDYNVGTRYAGIVSLNNATTVRIYPAGSTSPVTQSVPMTFAASDSIEMSFKVPIVGWSSSTVVSSSADTRVVAATITRNAAAFSASSAITSWNTTVQDTHGMVNLTNGSFTVKVPGTYQVELYSNYNTANAIVCAPRVNGTGLNVWTNDSSAFYKSISVTLPNLVAGDVVDFAAGSGSPPALSSFRASINMLQGPSQIAASEVVAFRAYRNTDQTGVNPNSSAVKIAFDTVTSDTHGGFSTANNRYTAPAPGHYVFQTQTFINSTNVLNSRYEARLYINGASVEVINTEVSAATAQFQRGGSSTPHRLNAGDYVEIYLFGSGNNSASTLTALGGSSLTYFGGYRLGGM